MKKYLLPLGAGVVVFGVATAFAASLSVTSPGLSAGNATVAACNASAAVTYNTAMSTGTNAGKYVVTTAPVTTGTGCKGLTYKVTLLDASDGSLAEQTGTLDATTGNATGAAAPDFTSSDIKASDVYGVAVVIAG